MTTLNRNTKKAQNFINSYSRANATALRDVYGSYSGAKERAYNDCRRWFAEDNGHDFRIMGANSQTFSAGWLYENAETGVVTLRIETYASTYIIEL